LHFDETIISQKNKAFIERNVKTKFLNNNFLEMTHCYGVDAIEKFRQEE